MCKRLPRNMIHRIIHTHTPRTHSKIHTAHTFTGIMSFGSEYFASFPNGRYLCMIPYDISNKHGQTIPQRFWCFWKWFRGLNMKNGKYIKSFSLCHINHTNGFWIYAYTLCVDLNVPRAYRTSGSVLLPSVCAANVHFAHSVRSLVYSVCMWM